MENPFKGDRLKAQLFELCQENFAEAFLSYERDFGMEFSLDLVAKSAGDFLGHFQAMLNNHCEECEKCRKRNMAMREHFVNAFVESFNAAEREKVAEFNAAATKADALLDKIVRSHK